MVGLGGEAAFVRPHPFDRESLEMGMRMQKGSKDGKLIIWKLIIGFVVASAFISLWFWRLGVGCDYLGSES